MLNPSFADHERDDNTITRQVYRAQIENRFGSLIVVNAFAYREVDPSKLVAAYGRGEDVVGPENDRHLQRVFSEAKQRGGLVFVGWGGNIAFMPTRSTEIGALAASAGVDLHCLRKLKSGHPGHPLYIAYSTPFVRWSA